MKRFLSLLLVFVVISAAAQDGYSIKITLKPFKNQYIYLGHYYGKQLPIDDSVLLNDKSEGVFKGPKKLGGGIYLIGYPGKNGFFEILLDKQQNFSIVADTAGILNKISFQNSQDNVLFNAYQKEMAVKGKEIADANAGLDAATTKADSAIWAKKLEASNKTVRDYREDLIKKYPKTFLSTLLQAMQEPEIPPVSEQPGGKYDSMYVYRYYKDHFWDGVSFSDDRLARTPFFDSKIDKYFATAVYPSPDSVNKEIDWMMGFASINDEMQKFLLVKFVNRYLTQKYMWEDAVFVHLFEKYFSQRSWPWLTEAGKKTITDRAYSLMANILGNPATDIDLPDTAGKSVALYSLQAPFTLVCIWDPTCGHCKETLPRIDSIYRAKWKALGVKIYAMARQTDNTINDWLKFIRNNNLQEWTNVYCSKEAEKARTDAGIPSYSQLYDVLTFPTLYLLDKDKHIIAKKLSFEQMDDVLSYKLKGMN
ncbi:MAG: DUF5106 domain-containing protein [Bacteroidetes bacterium]|nr:DUF5106 domain-containing protein [Bacteroidota bacterium]